MGDRARIQPAPSGIAAQAGAPSPAPVLREPVVEDGAALHRLIAECPPLDRNSRYCNLLQVSHFARTAIVAETGDGRLVGAVTGYRLPGAPEILFVWQVAVAPEARGRRLALRMLEALLARPACRGVRWLETSITPGNEASWSAFRAFARSRGAQLRDRAWLQSDRHFAGEHDDELLLRIGPLEPHPAASSCNETAHR